MTDRNLKFFESAAFRESTTIARISASAATLPSPISPTPHCVRSLESSLIRRGINKGIAKITQLDRHIVLYIYLAALLAIEGVKSGRRTMYCPSLSKNLYKSFEGVVPTSLPKILKNSNVGVMIS